MKKFLRIMGLVLALSIGSFGQNCPAFGTCATTATTSVSGTALQLSSNGGLVPGFNFSFSNGTGTVTTQGCIKQTCDTLDSYTGGTTNRTVDEFSVKAPTAPYDYFVITATFASGTFSVREVNNSTAHLGISSGGGGIPLGNALPFNNFFIGNSSNKAVAGQGNLQNTTQFPSANEERVNYAQWKALSVGECLATIEPFFSQSVASGEANKLCVINHHGDSVTATDGIPGAVRTFLQSYWHSGGPGWISNNTSDGSTIATQTPFGATVVRTGSWVDTNGAGRPFSYGPDNLDSSAAAAATSTITCPQTTDMYLWDVNGISTGAFTYNYNAAGAVTINETPGSATLNVTHLGPTAVGTQSLVITYTSGTIWPLGVYCLDTTNNGVIVNKLAANGSTVGDWDSWATNNPVALSELAQLNTAGTQPNMAVVADISLWGSNELLQNISPATFGTNFTTWLGTIATAYPNADYAVASSVDNGTAGRTYTMQQYANVLQDLARNNNAMYLGNWEYFRNYTRDNTLGLMANVTHPSKQGYQLLADNEKVWLTGGHFPQVFYQNNNLRSVYFDPSGNFPLAPTLALGKNNTSFGFGGLDSITSGTGNTVFGNQDGERITTGSSNVIVGDQAGFSIVSTSGNTFIGHASGQASTGNNNTAVGASACLIPTAQNGNICIGSGAGNGNGTTTGTHNTLVIGDSTASVTDGYLGQGISNTVAPAGINLHATGVTAGGTNNLAGGNYTESGGTGVGTGTPALVCQDGPVLGATGNSSQAMVHRHCENDYKALTSASAVTVLSLPLPADSTTGGQLFYTIRAVDITHHSCTRSGTITWAGENSNGTFVAAPAAATGNNENVACTSASTLIATWSLTGANPALLQVTATTNITITSMDIVYSFMNNGQTQPTP